MAVAKFLLVLVLAVGVGDELRWCVRKPHLSDQFLKAGQLGPDQPHVHSHKLEISILTKVKYTVIILRDTWSCFELTRGVGLLDSRYRPALRRCTKIRATAATRLMRISQHCYGTLRIG